MDENKKLTDGLELMVQFEKRKGLVPAVVQDFKSGEILMLGYVNQGALDETLKTGYATFWSTSRNELWKKGEKSGNFMVIKEILADCDQDSLVYKVEQIGKGACHTNTSNGEARRTCFYRRIKDNCELVFLDELK